MDIFDLDEPIRNVSRGAQLRRTRRENARKRAEDFYEKARSKGIAEYERDKVTRMREKIAKAKRLNVAIRAKERTAQAYAKRLKPAATILRFFTGRRTKAISFLQSRRDMFGR